MPSSAELAGRVAVVTGATSGIGAATARRLAAAGARVVVVARTAARVETLAREIDGIAVTADVTAESAADVIRAAASAAGADTIDTVVHAAGAFQLAPLAHTAVADFDEIVAVNLRAAFLLVRGFLPAMLARRDGDIVAIGSVAGRQAFPANGAYSASKFGLRGMMAVLSAELRGTGVRASLIEPTATATPLWDAIDRVANPGLPERDAMLAPDVVADGVLYAVTRPRDVLIPNILVERS